MILSGCYPSTRPGRPQIVNGVGLFTAFRVVIPGLQRDFAGPGEAVPANLARAGEEAGGEFLEHRLHLHGMILVNPATWFDVNCLASRKRNFKYITESVKPENAFTLWT